MTTTTDPTDRIPAHVERELVEADPRTCRGCHSTMEPGDDDTLICRTIGCKWRNNPLHAWGRR